MSMSARKRGTTRFLTGSTPRTWSASSSSRILRAPRSAVIAVPATPETMIAVISGANSRIDASTKKPPRRSSAPKRTRKFAACRPGRAVARGDHAHDQREPAQLQREHELVDELAAVRIRRPQRRHDRLAGQDHHVADLLEQVLHGEETAVGDGPHGHATESTILLSTPQHRYSVAAWHGRPTPASRLDHEATSRWASRSTGRSAPRSTAGRLRPGDRLPALRELAARARRQPQHAPRGGGQARARAACSRAATARARSSPPAPPRTTRHAPLVDEVVRLAADAGLSPRDLAAALYVADAAGRRARPGRRRAPRAARRDRRPRPPARRARGPSCPHHVPPEAPRTRRGRLLTTDELREQRDAVVRRIATVQRGHRRRRGRRSSRPAPPRRSRCAHRSARRAPGIAPAWH